MECILRNADVDFYACRSTGLALVYVDLRFRAWALGIDARIEPTAPPVTPKHDLLISENPSENKIMVLQTHMIRKPTDCSKQLSVSAAPTRNLH